MVALLRILERVNLEIGRIVAWTALATVLVQFSIVIFIAIFRIGGIVPMEESVLYYHSILFLLGAAYTLQNDGHVRVDIFYREASPTKKVIIDMFGLLVFLIPISAAVIYYSWPFMLQSWAGLEGSREPHGLHLIYIMKTFVFGFGVLILTQGVALLLRSILFLAGRVRSHWLPSD